MYIILSPPASAAAPTIPAFLRGLGNVGTTPDTAVAKVGIREIRTVISVGRAPCSHNSTALGRMSVLVNRRNQTS
ncbi:hypothetical protein MAR_024423 [Mya arenaria]|uniref:Uncharacterized protein n=1 Tax=Mya arenaria TaxID=6604 RepID=A0ABY7DTQ0_MYAAR|nr:hypothetical protein MAR_024423 [Mya arenaria]